MTCFALLDDCHATAAAPTSRLYTGFVREHRCDDPAALDAVWAAADRDLRAGLHAVVLADYEWGARLLHAGHERLAPADGGSLRVLMFEDLQHLAADAVDVWLEAREREETGGHGMDGRAPAAAGVLDIRPSVDHDAFCAAIARIHAAIGEGETYQVNYTYRLDFRTFGAPVSLYRRLRARQAVAFGAFIALPPGTDGPDYVLSCSPELFLRNQGGRLSARPMKGTAPRAREAEGDSEIARMLAGDTKNRAENLMIVDLLRNDLGRIARTGSVRVPALFSVEAYPTVFQMTSSIEAELPDDTGFPALLRALFPCGSITGAPKHRTMQIIAELENTPRGLYTGSIGWIDAPSRPEQACGDFCLSVAIRTLTLERRAEGGEGDEGAGCDGRMGVGAGIVIDSRAEEEFEECALKARFLTGLDPGFSLFETLYATREDGIRQVERHLARLSASAAALDFACPRTAIVAALRQQVAGLAPGVPTRMRLALHKDGRFEIVVAALEPLSPGPVEVLLAPRPIEDPHGLLAHKTTLRSRYDEGIRAAQARGAFDTLFFDAEGWLTEGGRSNVFLRIDGQWLTPPVGRGVLPGTMRAALLDDPEWSAREQALRVEDLFRAERIVLTNALRGVLAARLAACEAERFLHPATEAARAGRG
ncbi:MAG: para-aminobenzoate synthetase / 4-amino-4-deoxychorismate lyase [Rhodocyclaceae bacterium]|nr:para-aminobenzoate synthetase / 4-amino-4-deoxychorismate lyase [Rhodocyclaceae bacterium]